MIDSRLSDSQLVSLYQNGNQEAFEMLLHRHKSQDLYGDLSDRERQVHSRGSIAGNLRKGHQHHSWWPVQRGRQVSALD